MAILNPYLTFLGNCEEAFNFYKSVFGGEFSYLGRFSEMPPQKEVILSEDQQNKIMHVSLPVSKETVLMGSDAGQHQEAQNVAGNNISLSLLLESKEKADEVFSKLSENGAVAMHMEDTFWGDYFGICTDQFGIKWMIRFSESSES